MEDYEVYEASNHNESDGSCSEPYYTAGDSVGGSHALRLLLDDIATLGTALVLLAAARVLFPDQADHASNSLFAQVVL